MGCKSKVWLSFFWIGLLYACADRERELDLEVLDYVRLDSTYLKVEVLADSLEVPWDLEVDSEGNLWFTEQGGQVSRIELSTGKRTVVLSVPNVWRVRTSGLLAITAHPDFSINPYVFINYTTKEKEKIVSKLVRYTFSGDTLHDPLDIMTIAGGTSHNGSRITFGPDGKLYWATGDVHDYAFAQNPDIPNGKILRLNPDGSIPSDNPIPGSPVWALGFRNMQGLAFSDKGDLFTSEHGDAIEDEVNRIVPGGNYGWPEIEGRHDQEEEKVFADQNKAIEPFRSWTPVIAPAGLTHYSSSLIPELKNTLLLTTLKAKSLLVLQLSPNGDQVLQEVALFVSHYGRLRDVAVGKDGAVFLSTSNLDWNPQPGFPLPGDDKILRIIPTSKVDTEPLRPVELRTTLVSGGEDIYINYCASCHKEDGSGVPGVFPSIRESFYGSGSPESLVKLVIEGVDRDGTLAMPSFAFLEDGQLAEVLTYVRKLWGDGQVISVGQVQATRNKKN